MNSRTPNFVGSVEYAWSLSVVALQEALHKAANARMSERIIVLKSLSWLVNDQLSLALIALVIAIRSRTVGATLESHILLGKVI